MEDRAASLILGLSFEGMALDVILLVTIRTRFADLNFVDKDDVNGASAVQFGSDRTRSSIPLWPVLGGWRGRFCCGNFDADVVSGVGVEIVGTGAGEEMDGAGASETLVFEDRHRKNA